MQIASGKLVGGRIEGDAKLPEGATVTVIARDEEESFEVDPATEKMLLDAIAQCERGQTVQLKQVISGVPDRPLQHLST